MKIVRHSLSVRLSHWLIAVSGILLLFSGFGQMPMYARYNVVKIPGLAWSSDYGLTLILHYLFAAIFTAAVFFHLVYHLRRKEFAILPKRGDLGESARGFAAMFGLGKEPENGKFQAKQRMIYAIIGSTSLVLIATGLLKSYKNLGAIIVEPMILQWTAYLHTIFGMIFMMLFLAHVAALLLKSHRPLIPSMITGRINRDYVLHHHPKWLAEKNK